MNTGRRGFPVPHTEPPHPDSDTYSVFTSCQETEKEPPPLALGCK
ncbi:hypothetical protein GBAR_LOCUS27753 [Geodia barretti]|uniref:Uncharacterized protein n=1 Tax=Geodia barretti TaxID=519541 RepID=A0AA35X9L3_GEOBA|nr:hypothetical protein GBAR_LOCUS27753 [Geodia barretti]